MYYIKTVGKRAHRAKAHIWNGTDTLCTMHSTGGLKDETYEFFPDPNNKVVCKNCLGVLDSITPEARQIILDNLQN